MSLTWRVVGWDKGKRNRLTVFIPEAEAKDASQAEARARAKEPTFVLVERFSLEDDSTSGCLDAERVAVGKASPEAIQYGEHLVARLSAARSPALIAIDARIDDARKRKFAAEAAFNQASTVLDELLDTRDSIDRAEKASANGGAT